MAPMTREIAAEQVATAKTSVRESRQHYAEHVEECATCVLDTGPWCGMGHYRHVMWLHERGDLAVLAQKLTRRLGRI